MTARKYRTPVVLDTNVFIRSFKARSQTSVNRRVVRLWLMEKRLQLIVSQENVTEYLEVFADVLGMGSDLVEQWRKRFEHDRRCTLVNLARRYEESRDPDDNAWLATAKPGKAEHLITNDKDLLHLPESFRKTLPFAIVTPEDFLKEFTE